MQTHAIVRKPAPNLSSAHHHHHQALMHALKVTVPLTEGPVCSPSAYYLNSTPVITSVPNYALTVPSTALPFTATPLSF